MKKIIFIIIAMTIIITGCSMVSSDQESHIPPSVEEKTDNSCINGDNIGSEITEIESIAKDSVEVDEKSMVNKRISMVKLGDDQGYTDYIEQGFIDGCEVAGIDYEVINIHADTKESRIDEFKEYLQQEELTGICLNGTFGDMEITEYCKYIADSGYIWLNYFDSNLNYSMAIEEADIVGLTPSYKEHVEELFTYLQNAYKPETSIGAICFCHIDFKNILSAKLDTLYPNSPEIISYDKFMKNPDEYISKTDVIYCDMPDVLNMLLGMNCEQSIIYSTSSFETNYIELLEYVKSGKISAITLSYDRYEMGYMAAMYLSGYEVLDEKEFRLAPIVISTPEQAQRMIDVLQK